MQGGLQLGAASQAGGLRLNAGLGQPSGEWDVVVAVVTIPLYM